MLFFSAPLHCFRKTSLFRFLVASRLNKPIFFDLGFEHKVALRPITHASIWLGKSKLEPSIRKLIVKICHELNKKDIACSILDVGANTGLYTWEVAQICPKFKILSFEPDPNNFELLQMTHVANASKNVELYPFALSKNFGESNFFQDNLTSATGCLADNNKPWVEQYLNGSSKKISVYTHTLDQMTVKDTMPALIKIDVEGHENEVLEGGMQTIEISKPVLIIESFPPKQQRVVKTLGKIGYQFYDADRLSPLQDQTSNLIAWHTEGPIEQSKLKSFLSA